MRSPVYRDRRVTAGSSLAGALHAADKLPAGAAGVFVTAARTAFVDGIHVAAIFGVALGGHRRRSSPCDSCPAT